MLPQLSVAILVFFYEALVLLGAAMITARLIGFCMRESVPENCRLLLGFALYPPLVTWGGYLLLWRIPLLTQAAGLLCAAVAVRGLWSGIRRTTWAQVYEEGRWYVVPGLFLLLLFWMKSGYLLAGHSHGDEGRSIAFVTTFAHNALKPGYLFDISLPVAYPYYLFQAAAFGYRSVGGFLYPTIPLFAATMFAVFFSFRAMHLASRELFRENGNRLFVVGTVILIFSSLHAYGRFLKADMPYLFNLSVNPINEYWHAGYHYVWGISLAFLGVAYLWTFMQTLSRNPWFIFVLCICLAFGYAGIPILWMIVGIVMLLVLFMIQKRMEAVTLFLRVLPFSLFLWCLILLPQIFNFLPRIVPQFSLSLPHVWYLHDVQGVLEYTGHSYAWLKQVMLGPLMIIRGAGLLVFLSLPFGVVYFFRHVRSFATASPLFPLSAIITAAALIQTFTVSITSDWFSRGFIGTIIIGSFVAAYALLPFLFTKKYTVLFAMIAIPLFTLHGIAFALDYAGPHFHKRFTEVRTWNQYPLDTVFYSQEFGTGADDLIFAGRQVITMPPPPLFAYFLHPDTYSKLGLGVSFLPCKSSWYGSNTPSGEFINIDSDPPALMGCVGQPK